MALLVVPLLVAQAMAAVPTMRDGAAPPAGPLDALALAIRAAGLDLAVVKERATPPTASADSDAAYARLLAALRVPDAPRPLGGLLPEAYAPGMIRLLDAVAHAVDLQTAAVAGLDVGRFAAYGPAYHDWHATGDRAALAAAWSAGLPGVDRTGLAAAAWTLLVAAHEGARLLDPARGVPLSSPCVEDPLGLVLVCGPGPDLLQGDRLLVVDVGGDDRHETNAGASGLPILSPASNGLPVALSLDLIGNDQYVGGHSVQGAASTTAGVLVDLDGHDTYRADDGFFTFAQGAGNLGGVGVLHDALGNDRYLAPAGADGSGVTAWDSQGFGILGGIGLLFDAEGSDLYVGGTMAMGVGDFNAVGMLVDLAGSDGHEAVRWSQGFADGGAVGLAWDVSGDDGWWLSDRRGQGAGIGGTGILLEGSGSDTYGAAGSAQGWAVGGPAWKPANDVLTLLGLALPGHGVLIDTEGADSYGGSLGCNGCLWTQESGGFGVDL